MTGLTQFCLSYAQCADPELIKSRSSVKQAAFKALIEEQGAKWGAGIAQWLERRTKRSRVRIPAGTAGEFSGSTFCADSYFGIRSTPVLPQ